MKYKRSRSKRRPCKHRDLQLSLIPGSCGGNDNYIVDASARHAQRGALPFISFTVFASVGYICDNKVNAVRFRGLTGFWPRMRTCHVSEWWSVTRRNSSKDFTYLQGWVIRHRRIIRRIVFIAYLTVFFKLLRIILFWVLKKFCSHKPPKAPQKHSQAL